MRMNKNLIIEMLEAIESDNHITGKYSDDFFIKKFKDSDYEETQLKYHFHLLKDTEYVKTLKSDEVIERLTFKGHIFLDKYRKSCNSNFCDFTF